MKDLRRNKVMNSMKKVERNILSPIKTNEIKDEDSNNPNQLESRNNVKNKKRDQGVNCNKIQPSGIPKLNFIK